MRPAPTRLAGLSALASAPAGAARDTPLLFLHGINGGAWMFAAALEAFAVRGWRGVAIDLRGHHDSRRVDDLGRVSIADYVEDAAAAVEALGRPIVIGHSMGGLIAQKLAERVALPAVVLVAPAAPRGIFALASLAVARSTVRHLPSMLAGRPFVPSLDEARGLLLHRLPPGEARAVHARFVPESGRAARALVVPGVPVDARRVTSRMLVLAGSEDRMTPASVVRKVAAKYRAEYREYDGHAHMLLMEPGWESIVKEVADWL